MNNTRLLFGCSSIIWWWLKRVMVLDHLSKKSQQQSTPTVHALQKLDVMNRTWCPWSLRHHHPHRKTSHWQAIGSLALETSRVNWLSMAPQASGKTACSMYDHVSSWWIAIPKIWMSHSHPPEADNPGPDHTRPHHAQSTWRKQREREKELKNN